MGFWEFLFSGFISTAVAATVVAQMPVTEPIIQAPIPAVQPQSKVIKVDVTISAIRDIVVSENQQVAEGEIIADRKEQRAVLEINKRKLNERLKTLELTKILEPQPLRSPTETASLPAENYAEEEAAIASTQLRVKQVQEAYKNAAAGLTTLPTEQFTQVEKARINLEKLEKDAQLQDQMLTQVKQLPEVLTEMVEHNEQKLTQLISKSEEARTEYRLKQAELNQAISDRKVELTTLQTNIDKAQADLELSKSKLISAKSQRKYLEYRHQITIAQRTDERSQAEQIYARQRSEHQQQISIKESQLNQVQQQIGDVEIALSKIAAIRSPVTGRIRRIKWTGQNNNELSATITIVSANSDRVPAAINKLGGNQS